MTRSPLRWIYHLVAGDPVTIGERLNESSRFTPASIRTEGFVHGSFRDAVVESARLYMPRDASGATTPWCAVPVDPRRLDVSIVLAATPRGPMPHVMGSIPRDALGAPVTEAELDAAPDHVEGTRLALVSHAASSSELTKAARALQTYATCKVVVPTATTDKPLDFDALVIVDPSVRSYATGLPRSRRVFTWGPNAVAQVAEWLSFPFA